MPKPFRCARVGTGVIADSRQLESQRGKSEATVTRAVAPQRVGRKRLDQDRGGVSDSGDMSTEV